MKRLSFAAAMAASLLVVGTVGGCAHSTGSGKTSVMPPPAAKADAAKPQPGKAPPAPVIVIVPRQLEDRIPSPAAMRMQGKMKVFWQAWELVQKQHIGGPYTDEQMLEGAIRGLAGVTKDKHTRYWTPDRMKEWATEDTGKYAGIGAVLTFEDKKLYIDRVMPNSPAQKAGLLAGDEVTQVDGSDTGPLGLVGSVKLIRGLKGSPTVLTIVRHGVAKPFKVIVTRDELVLRSAEIKMLYRNGKRLAHITLDQFNKPALRDFRRAALRAIWWKADGVILDLRWNPGGYVSVVRAIASAWIGEQVLFYEKDSQFRLQPLEATEMNGVTNAFRRMPTVVLINKHSASASEILAGALQDYGRATIVGEKSYGKGSVQILNELVNGGGLTVTVRHWLTPKKHKIHGIGVKPDVAVERPLKLTDAELEARRQARAAGKHWEAPDPQMDKAVELLTMKQTAKRHHQKRRQPAKAKRR